MTLSSALQSAFSGLTANSRASQIVSENIANASTPGYVRRSLELAARPPGASGVQVVGLQRHVDPALTASRRSSDAALALASDRSRFHARVETLVGAVGDPGSIAARLAGFDASLIAAASLPDSVTRLDNAAGAAADLARAINDAAEGLRQQRSEADRRIGQLTDRANSLLQNIETMNRMITETRASGQDISSLLDQRGLAIDELNGIIPVNAVGRGDDTVTLYSTGGLVMLEGQAGAFQFQPVNQTMPHMSAANGLLSGLGFNGLDVRTAGSGGPIAGGSLAAQFEIRDELALDVQSNLDALARDLVERFQAPGVDPTMAPGAPGLFTDDGSAFSPADETGLANRLTLNALADPDAGGDSWRLRSGLGAPDPGEPGDAGQLNALSAALNSRRTLASPIFGTGQLSARDVSAGLLSVAGQSASQAAGVLAFAAANQTELARQELANGVDTDAELQTLMRVEQAYAANARVIEVVDDLMGTLLRL